MCVCVYNIIVLIYNSRTFEIHLPGVVDVIGVPMIEVVVAVILVVEVVGVISMIRLDTKLTYCKRKK